MVDKDTTIKSTTLDPINLNLTLQKELDFIQNCVSRMAHNSFLIKGWSVTIFALVGTLLGINNSNPIYFCILFPPLILFWCLDGFFLSTEKKYREKYDEVRHKRLIEHNTSELYSLTPKSDGSFIKNGMFTKTIWPFYSTLLGMTIAIMLIVMNSA